jgi:hypothetical protein
MMNDSERAWQDEKRHAYWERATIISGERLRQLLAIEAAARRWMMAREEMNVETITREMHVAVGEAEIALRTALEEDAS